jgi:acetylglutamate/LysW-gamma-L-alpha-aminoadipate kinase
LTVNDLLVVKIGGGAGVDLRGCAADLAQVAQQRPLIVVHGVSARLNQLCEERGMPVRMITSPTGHSSRYTDAATRDLFVEAALQINAELAALLRADGVNVVGATLTPDPSPTAARGEGEPVRGIVLRGERKDAIRAVVDGRIRVIRDDYSGTITSVERAYLQDCVAVRQVAAVPPLAQSTDGLLNVDGDRAAAAIAGALGAADLVILSNVRGLYKNFPDEASFVSQVARNQLDSAAEWAQGRMKRKVLGAQEALQAGVQRVIIADGRIAQPISAALSGAGTHFV